MLSSVQRRVIGSMLGLAAADRNGGPQRMAMRVAEEFTRPAPDAGHDRFLAVLSRYMSWDKGGPDEPDGAAFDTGQVFNEVVTPLVRRGVPPSASDALAAAQRAHEITGSAGVNPAHRNAILGLCSPNGALPTLGAVAAAARAECMLTHLHSESVNVAVASAVIIRALLLHEKNAAPAAAAATAGRGQQRMQALQAAVGAAMQEVAVQLQQQAGEGYSHKKDELTMPVLQKIAAALGGSGAPPLSAPTDRGGRSPLVLYAALYFLCTTQSFNDACNASIAFAGGANFCPVLVGSIGGALYGVSEKTLQRLREKGMEGCDQDDDDDDDDDGGAADDGVLRANLDHRYWRLYPNARTAVLHQKRYLALAEQMAAEWK
jgi:ADP-ribosylglycohydrolase